MECPFFIQDYFESTYTMAGHDAMIAFESQKLTFESEKLNVAN